MAQAFIIMQIGDTSLDHVCEHAIVPAIKACNLTPKRVDKHNEGQLLKSEIVRFIQSSELIIADLTNERPNCYLEVGYGRVAQPSTHRDSSTHTILVAGCPTLARLLRKGGTVFTPILLR